MAFIPFFALGPSSLMSILGLLHGPDKTIPTPKEDWREATLDLIIPSYNEEKNIVLCLASIMQQTIKPRQIVIFDDASEDRTVEYAKYYSQFKNMNIRFIIRKKNEGKTPSIYYAALHSDANVLAIVDADTILQSSNYLERLVQELYQGVGIASACGLVLPLAEKDRTGIYQKTELNKFSNIYPDIEFTPDRTWFQRMQRGLTNYYREELYLFLQRLVYHGEMVFFGTLIFPIGCAVAYRREYLKDILDHYHQIFGFDLTTSEDIFFGFAFDRKGYRNIVVQDVFAHTQEPRFSRILHQIYKWSSAFLQSCYYFNSLFFTPIKFPNLLLKIIRQKTDPEYAKILEKRKIKEQYRQPFGNEYTKKYGRLIGWFIFTTALEKITFPAFILIFIILRFWEALLITFIAETAIYTITIAALEKGKRLRNFFKAILLTPIRYMQIMFDLFVAGKFMIDIWITKNRHWRK